MSSKTNEDVRARAEATFKKKELQAQEADKVWAERAVAEKATDQNAARLKGLRLARDAAEKPSTPKVAKKEKPPTGTKGEEISSQGQLDEGTRRRTRPRGSAK
jgi:hypothetical protein